MLSRTGFMKKYLMYGFLFFTTCICSYGYSEAPLQEATPHAVPDTSSNQAQQSKPPKNYFDIKADEKEGDRFIGEFMNMLTTLGLIVAIILIATWFLKKMVNSRIQQMNTVSLIKIVERRTLSPKTSLYLVDIHGRGFILSESINGVTSLGNFDVNEMENAQKPSFKDIENK